MKWIDSGSGVPRMIRLRITSDSLSGRRDSWSLPFPVLIPRGRLGTFLFVTLFAILHAFAPPGTGQEPQFMLKALTRAPQSFSCNLYTASGRSTVGAERAVYKVGVPPGGFECSVVAFFDKGTRQCWIGREFPVFVSTRRGIVGLGTDGPVIQWSRSLLNGGGNPADLPQLWAAFEKDVAPEKLTDLGDLVMLRGSLSEDFFTDRPQTSKGGRPAINNVRLNGGQIELDMSSEGGDLKAEVILDENTLKLKSAKLVK